MFLPLLSSCVFSVQEYLRKPERFTRLGAETAKGVLLVSALLLALLMLFVHTDCCCIVVHAWLGVVVRDC